MCLFSRLWTELPLAEVPDPLPGQIWDVAIFPSKILGGENNSSPELQLFRDQAASPHQLQSAFKA